MHGSLHCVVFMDDLYSHITNIPLFKLCIESGKDIRLTCLPSGQTDKLQPLDSRPFGTMKAKWSDYKLFHHVDPQFEEKSSCLSLLYDQRWNEVAKRSTIWPFSTKCSWIIR
ncbi:hypothetical protein RvY_02192-2 [Ramazzottius varieornatus]|nr:hypothetical protein RvY_02192-2 [Ramazzottius varieornatus]